MTVLFLVRLALLGLAATPGASHGVEHITGTNFSAYCASANWETACKTCALGLYHGSQLRNPTVCLPDGIDMDRLQEIGIEYIRTHPARGQEVAFLLFLEAWEREYPCEIRRE